MRVDLVGASGASGSRPSCSTLRRLYPAFPLSFRQGSYFKVEQEADLRRHAEKLMAERQASSPPPLLPPPEAAAPGDLAASEAADPASVRSLAAYETLPEILQQAARVEDRSSLAHRRWLRTFDRRVAAKHPEPPDWAVREARRLASPLEYARPPAIPAGTFGRTRWGFEERRAAREAAGGGGFAPGDGRAWGDNAAWAAGGRPAPGPAPGAGTVAVVSSHEVEAAGAYDLRFSPRASSHVGARPPALRRGPSPAQVEASQRMLAAATRSMAYGTLLCLLAAASGAVAGAHALNAAGGVEAVRGRIREHTGDFGAGFRSFFQPWVERIRQRVGGPATARRGGGSGDTDGETLGETASGGAVASAATAEVGTLAALLNVKGSGDAPVAGLQGEGAENLAIAAATARTAHGDASAAEPPRGSVALLRQRLAQRYNPNKVAELAGVAGER